MRDAVPGESFAQVIFRGLMRARSGSLQERFFWQLRNKLKLFGDPVIDIPIGGTEIRAHCSHNLPLYKKHYKFYDTALPRLLRQLTQDGSRIAVIDIGANIGDTAAALLENENLIVICIECGDEFMDLLLINMRPYGSRVEIEGA